MTIRHALRFTLLATLLVASTSIGIARPRDDPREPTASSPVVEAVREATAKFRDVGAAINLGYVPVLGCVSGPDQGAMGAHYVRPELFDGNIQLEMPEALVYEPTKRGLELVAIEYIVPAESWRLAHPAEQPLLMGHLFHYEGSPNRYGIDPFYALHVWAWRDNPNGLFADWNPSVSCAAYSVAQP